MPRRTGAAVLLCCPLVAGCGAVTREDFTPHSRPASPLHVSVLMGRYGASFDPDILAGRHGIRPGPVLFDIVNRSGYEVRFWVGRHGRALARTPMIASGQPAQLKAVLTGSGISFHTHGINGRRTESSSQSLKLVGPARTGDGELAQP